MPSFNYNQCGARQKKQTEQQSEEAYKPVYEALNNNTREETIMRKGVVQDSYKTQLTEKSFWMYFIPSVITKFYKNSMIDFNDEDVTKKSGIYYYVFDGNEKHLSIRAFLDRDKRTVYTKQGGICPYCKKHFDFEQMQG